MRTVNLLFLLIHVLAISFDASAQTCGNCNEAPRITQFDFDIRVPQPHTANGTNNLWPEWKNLFMIASSVGTNLKKADGGCIRLTFPPAIDTGDAQVARIGGETFSNLPTNPLLDKDLSIYGDYLLTGTITSDGMNCRIHAEIQTSCSRKKVVSADVTFSLSSVMSNVNNIAQQVASQLSPLAQKIKQFELEERKTNPALSLFRISNGDIQVKPLKRTLKSGESTTVTFEVKDCDGVPLAGRD
ncbi:MAG TPA: hypothetical protein VJT83_04620, partial [Chitinophagaceae bacterium]|nr:hypothetical protein [Chitinophagaceae bacterium]